MIKEFEFETYLSISNNELAIYLFDPKNFTNLYEKKINFENKINYENFTILSKFLEENIFLIEKSIGQFVKNIYLIIENKNISTVQIGVKKKNYEEIIKKNFFEISLINIKDLFKESYTDKKIMHMLINRILVNGHHYSSYEENIKGDHICIEIEFKSIENKFALEINKILERYQLGIIKYIDREYIEEYFINEKPELPHMAHKIINGCNLNEINLIPRNVNKIRFFEKFFQLFS